MLYLTDLVADAQLLRCRCCALPRSRLRSVPAAPRAPRPTFAPYLTLPWLRCPLLIDCPCWFWLTLPCCVLTRLAAFRSWFLLYPAVRLIARLPFNWRFNAALLPCALALPSQRNAYAYAAVAVECVVPHGVRLRCSATAPYPLPCYPLFVPLLRYLICYVVVDCRYPCRLRCWCC